MANTVTVTVDADTSAAQKNVRGMGEKFRSAMKGVAVAAGSLTLGAGAAAKLGQEYQEATNTIAAGTGATGAQLEGLTESFKDVWATVPQDAAAVSAAIADVNTEMALTGAPLEDVTKAFLDVSRAMGEEASPMIKAVADAMIAFGVPAEDTRSQLDKLTTVSQAVGVPMTALANTVVNFGPQLATMGLSLDESTALIANMEAAGLSASKMMPGLNTAVGKLAKDGVKDIRAGLKDMIASIENAETDTEALAIATSNFGAGAGLRFKDAIDKGVFSLDAMIEAMSNSEGKVADLGAATLTMSDKFDIMKNRVKEALTPIGSFATALGPMVIMIPALATGISALAASQTVATAATWLQAAAMTALNFAMGPIGLIILGIVAAITAAILIFKNWDTIIQTLRETWETVSSAISEAFQTYFAFMLPGGALFNAIDTLKATWAEVWGAIKETWDTVTGAIYDAFNSKFGWLLPGGILIKAIQGIRENWEAIWAAIEILAIVGWEKISEAFVKYFGWALPGGAIHEALIEIKAAWDSIWDGVKTKFNTLSKAILKVWTDYFGWLRPGGAIHNALKRIKETWDSTWDGIKGTFIAIGGFIKTIWTDYFGWIRPGGAVFNALDAFRDKWKAIWDAVKGFVKGPINLIIDGVNKLIDLLNAIELGWEPKKVRGVTVIPGFKFDPFNIPHIPKLAAGGIVRSPTLAMIGERGPEAVVPLGAGSGAGGITINILGPTYGLDDFERRVAEAVRDGARRGGFQGILQTA